MIGAIVVGVGAIGFVAWGAMQKGGRGGDRTETDPPEPDPTRVTIAGWLDASDAGAMIVLREGERQVAEIAATATFAFDPVPDRDGDGRVDAGWSAALRRGACEIDLEIDRSAPEAQRWAVPTADASAVGDLCRVSVAGLDGAGLGSVIAFDGEDGRRFAVVDQVERGRVEAATLGAWPACEACAATLSSCAVAAGALISQGDDGNDDGAESRALLADKGHCPEDVVRALRGNVVPEPEPSRRECWVDQDMSCMNDSCTAEPSCARGAVYRPGHPAFAPFAARCTSVTVCIP